MPIVAKSAGMARAASGRGDAFDELIDDHRRVTAALEKATVEQSPAKKLALFALIKRDLSKHSVAEEDVIYPLVADTLLDPEGAHQLYQDHGNVKTFLAEIEEALENGDDARYRTKTRALLAAVREHANEEETLWFPRLRELLDDKKRVMVAGKVDREKALLA